jgi:amidohydrolase
MILKNDQLDSLINLRRSLHKTPELSGKEKVTPERIRNFISQFEPDEIVEYLGGNGLAFVFKGNEPGPTLMFRSELDALPIDEINDFEYRSKYKNIGHKCGHDGHMSIISGLGVLLSDSKIVKGKIILLFQPAEETGEGAEWILQDKKFENLQPDYVLALHNLPGFPKSSVITKPEHFASASKGMIIKLTGKTSHAAEPENGISPAFAVSDLIKALVNLPETTTELKDFALVTLINVNLGERAFGTSPGYAEVMATLRTYRNDDMDILTEKAVDLVKEASANYRLKQEIEWTEEFPATINHKETLEVVEKAASKLELKNIKIDKPFKWSEDFGHFTNKYNGALFGLGSGKNHPQLHNPDYDFPEELIRTGVEIFYEVLIEFGMIK